MSSTKDTRKLLYKIMEHPAADVFDSDVYISCFRTFYAYYGTIPNCKRLNRIDHQKAIGWLNAEWSNGIVKRHNKEYYNYDKRRMECENAIFLLEDELLVDIENNGVVFVAFSPGKENKAQALIDQLKRFKRRHKRESRISVIVSTSRGLDVNDIKCPRPKLQLSKHYNDELGTVHADLIRALSRNDKSGLVLFHGQPGTGKSTYIRHLIGSIRKQFIFLSPKLAGNLDAPNFINLLIENRNSVLVIEDAEELLTSREKTGNSAISILLNLTDGILGESLGIQTICTFNTGVQNIDEALMRKGRLLALYEFKPLAPHKANLLLAELGTGVSTSQPMTLANIYNTDKKEFNLSPARKQIGFRVA